MQTRPSSFKASLISRILILSRALLENLLSFAFSGSSSSSLMMLLGVEAGCAPPFFLLAPPFPPPARLLLLEVTRPVPGDRGSEEYGEPDTDISSAFRFLPPGAPVCGGLWVMRGGAGREAASAPGYTGGCWPG